jgi:hypothetical protein
MRGHLSTARFATVVALVLGLFVTGVVAGAAGSNLIIGSEANNAGTSNTQLLTNSNVVAFKLLQNGPGTALMGYATPTTGGTRGVYGRTDSPNGDGVQARNGAATAGTGAAISAFGQANVGARIDSDTADGMIVTSGVCMGLFCGRNGIESTGYGFGSGVVGTGGAVGVTGSGGTAIGLWGDGDTWALHAQGDVNITGDLNVGGTCTGCTVSTLAVNGDGAALKAGDAVTITGFTTDAHGNVMLTVAKAKGGDTVVGIVDAGLAWQETRTDSGTSSGYAASGTSAAPGGAVRVVTSGIALLAAADTSGGAIAAGDSLVASTSAGKLAKGGGASAGKSLGYALGSLSDGVVAVWISPH